MSEYTGRKFKVKDINTGWHSIYTIGAYTKKQLLLMKSEMVYKILDKEGRCVSKMSYLDIKDNFKNGTYIIVW